MDFSDITPGVYILFVVGMIGLVAVGFFAHFNLSTGSGTLSDSVFSVEESGFVWKTNRVWFTNDHTEMYCALNPEVLAKLKTALIS